MQQEHNFDFLKSKAALILTIALLIQAALLYGFTRDEATPETRPLASVPTQFGSWQLVQEGVVEKEVQEVLKADDTLTRSYANANDGSVPGAHLWVAYFKTQRTGRAPHSPKNCLPGTGWVPSVSDRIAIPIAGREPIDVNRYIVQKGDAKSLVFYWYQSRDRVVASEYEAKFYVIADAMRYNRTDTALVRVVVPITQDNPEIAEKAAINFIQSFFVPLRQYFPA